MRKAKPRLYHGKEVTIPEISEKLGVPKTSLYRAMEKMSFEEAVDYCIKHKQTDLSDRTGERSCSEIEKENNLTPNTLAVYLRKHPNASLEEAIDTLENSKQEKSFTPNQLFYRDSSGKKVFTTVAAYAMKIGCGSTALYDHLAEGLTLEEAGKKIIENKKNPIITSNGQTLRQDCIDKGRNPQVVRGKINAGLSQEEATEEYLRTGQKSPKTWKYTFHGIILHSLLLRYQVDPVLVKKYLREEIPLMRAIEKALFFRKTEKIRSITVSQLLFELYQEIESAPSSVRLEVLERSSLPENLKSVFDQKYNHLALIKRDFFLIEILDKIETKPEEEQVQLLREHQVTKEEYQYIQNLLSQNFNTAEVLIKQSSDLTYQRALYYNKPINYNKKNS